MLAGVLVVFTAVNVALMRDVRGGALPADRPITFDQMSMSVYSRVGNPVLVSDERVHCLEIRWGDGPLRPDLEARPSTAFVSISDRVMTASSW